VVEELTGRVNRGNLIEDPALQDRHLSRKTTEVPTVVQVTFSWRR
jgi:hypothetical protein